MSDRYSDPTAFLTMVRGGASDIDAFGHRDHIYLAWLLCHGRCRSSAFFEVCREILGLANRHGRTMKFNLTLSVAWTALIHEALKKMRQESFESFWLSNPICRDKHLLFTFYTAAHLRSDTAKKEWVEPDLLPLPLTLPIQPDEVPLWDGGEIVAGANGSRECAGSCGTVSQPIVLIR